MKTYLFTFLMALTTSLILTRTARWVGRKVGVVDVAWGRKIHSGEIPRLGGPAVALAFFLPVYGLLLWDNRLADLWRSQGTAPWALLVGGAGAVLLGLADDIWRLRARYKLLAQIGIAVATYYLGIQVHLVRLPLLGELHMGAFALPVTVAWILAFMNALNLVDGADGLCAGIVFIASLTVFAISWSFGSALVALMTVALAGSALGFLRYNFNPATIFLGDSGSYFFGFVLAAASLMGAAKALVATATVVPLLAMGLPFMDTLMAITRRTALGRPIFAPDRGHIHHRLLDGGLSVRKAVLALYGGTALFAAIGLIVAFGHDWEAGLALAVILIGVWIAVRTGGYWPQLARIGRRIVSEADEDFRRYLPELLERLAHCRAPEEARAALEHFVRASEMIVLEIRSPEHDIAWRFAADDERERSTRPHISATYPLYPNVAAREGAVIYLSWSSELGRVLAGEAALLKVTAVLLGRTLSRCSGSEPARSQTRSAQA